MSALTRKNPQAPSKAAILNYLEKKKKEGEAAKEKRFQEMLNPYKKFSKKGEPDEEFLKAQRKKEKMAKKKEEMERKMREQMDRERVKKQNEELERLRKEQEEHRALEEKRRQERIRKQAIFGKPVDKKMQEYLERIKAQRESQKQKGPDRKRLEERKRQEERLLTSAKVRDKSSQEEKERERRILENMKKQQNKSINSKDGKSLASKHEEYVPSKKSTLPSRPLTAPSLTSTTSIQPRSSSSSSSFSSAINNKIPKTKPRVSEYSPTRPSIIEKSHESNRSSKRQVEEYFPTEVNKTKEAAVRSKMDANRSSHPYVPTPKVKTLSKADVKENGHKLKARPVSVGGGGGDPMARSLPSSSSSISSSQPTRKPVKDDNRKQTVPKSSKDSISEKERLLNEKELEAERELERQRAKNKALEEELARLKRERELEKERELAKAKLVKKKPPIASNKILPPIGLTYRRNMNYQPVTYDEDDEEDDDEMRDFIDDGDDLEAQKSDVSHYIREIFGYDKRKYAMIDDDDIEEASFAQQMKEEMESAKAGLLEDLEDMRKEEQEKRRKAKFKRRRQVLDSDSD